MNAIATVIEPEAWEPPLVALVGMGVGDVSRCALRWIERGQILAGGIRLLGMFPDHPGRRIPLRSSLGDFLDTIKEVCRGERTVVLASGDPLFFGIGSRLISHMGKERVVVIPGITSIQGLFARLGEPWEGIQAVSLHGREDEAMESRLLHAVGRHSRVAVFTDPVHTPGWIARRLLEAGVVERSMVVGEDLGQPTESVREYALEEVLLREFSPTNLVAVFARDTGNAGEEQGRNLPILGFPEEAFEHEAGLITKLEVRAVVLACLRLCHGQVLWDLGAASGSVAIEASRIVPLRRVFAVEKREDRVRSLRENIRRFECFEISVVNGSAMEVVDSLPDPDRVFIGGSGDELEGIQTKVGNRLRPGGRVVQTAVTFETLERARHFWMHRGMEVGITQLQISRSVPLGRSERLDALNPVFVITASSAGA
ncbi:MAG: precorrin-6y C5,15-methyltransferase (decarboxylating) subunit CbiE [Deltaproteobacteria bacterium]|nr:precorrin-6y C5,15-methyltransferase (decarboxylating) subunit CbiE [Deltaproteobacteria bacterium]